MKKCTKCKIIKPETEFYYERAAQCKECIREYNRERYRQKHPTFKKQARHENMPSSYTIEYYREYRRRQGKSVKSTERILLLRKLRENGLRQCYKCKEIKTLEEFKKHGKKSKSKYSSLCKECQRQYYKEWYKKHNRNRNKKAVKACSLFNQYMKENNIQRPQFCSICGKEDNIRAHHPDYSKPLEIIWVCRQCHREIHS